MYIIKFTDEGLADVKALEKNEKNFLKKEMLDRLGSDPVGHSEALDPPLEEYRSAHIGDYRVVLKVYEDLKGIAVAGVGKHDGDATWDVYKKLEALADQGKLAGRMVAALRGFTRY